MRCVQLSALLLVALHHVTALSELSSVCPYTEFCTKEARIITNQEQDCCRPCSCSDLCELVGNCCPDKIIQNNTYALYKYPCLTQEEIYFRYLNINETAISGGRKFRIVTSCHVPLSDEETLMESMQENIARCHKASAIKDLVFVTSTSSGITYLNKHCAECNKEYAYSEWTLGVTESIDFERLSSETWEEYILKTGHVLSFPSKEEDLRSTLCPDMIVDKCNATDDWNVYDRVLETKCAQFDYIYYALVRGKVRAFRNQFCYLCNIPQNTNVKHQCTNMLMDYEFSYLMFISRTTSSSVFALLVPKKSRDISTGSVGAVCNKTEIIDPFQEKCTELLCPPGYFALYGKCETVFSNSSGITTNVYFDLEISIDIDVTILQKILTELASNITKYVNDKRAYCENCESDITLYTDEALILRMVFRSSKHCHHLHYMERFSKLCLNSFSIFSAEYNTSIKLTCLYDYNYAFKDVLIFVPFEHFSFCPINMWYTVEKVHCPSLEIPVSDIETLQLDQQVKEKIFKLSTNVRNEMIRICLSDYNRVFLYASKAISHRAVSCLYTLLIVVPVTLIVSLKEKIEGFV